MLPWSKAPQCKQSCVWSTVYKCKALIYKSSLQNTRFKHLQATWFSHKPTAQKHRIAGCSNNMSNAERCKVSIIPKYQGISYRYFPGRLNEYSHTPCLPLLQVWPLTPVTRTEACNLLLSLMRPILPFSYNQTILPDKKQVQGVRKRSRGTEKGAWSLFQ